MTPRAHSSMAEQPAHNRLGLGSSPGGPTIVAGAWRPALTAGGLIEARVAPVGGQPERSGRVAPLRGQPDCCSELVAPVRGQPERSRRGWLRSADNPIARGGWLRSADNPVVARSLWRPAPGSPSG